MESELSAMVGATKSLDKEIERLQSEAKTIPAEIDALEIRHGKIRSRIVGLVEQRNVLLEDINMQEHTERSRKQKEREQIVRREEKLRGDQARLAEEAWTAAQIRRDQVKSAHR